MLLRRLFIYKLYSAQTVGIIFKSEQILPVFLAKIAKSVLLSPITSRGVVST